jgi:hypothetical protein
VICVIVTSTPSLHFQKQTWRAPSDLGHNNIVYKTAVLLLGSLFFFQRLSGL